MKTIATFSKPEEAHLLRMHLGGAGIEAFVLDENAEAAYSNVMGVVRVQVADVDLAAAQEVLASDTGISEK